METIKIGFDEIDMDTNPYGEEEELCNGPVMKTELKPLTVSPERFEKMCKVFDHAVVHEFGDEYHLSEEERQAKNAYYETFKLLRKAKKAYNHIDEYVEVMRIALKCLDKVAENNGIYDPEKFKIMYLRGEIEITGLKFPKYKGRDKKNLSWDYIAEFIVSDRDPEELLPKESEILTNDDIEVYRNILFTPEQLERLEKSCKKHDDEITRPFDPDIDDPEEFGVAEVMGKKEMKKFLKAQPESLYIMKEIKRGQKAAEKLDSMVYDLVLDDLEMIAKYDEKHGYESSSDMPKFHGNILKKKDFKKYMYELDEYEKDNVRVNYGGKMRTVGEIREAELKAALEKDGWDIRALYGNREKEKKLKQARKRDEAEKRKLKRKLAEIDKRNKKRLGEEQYLGGGKKKKKNKKKSKSSEDG